jgi:hypothetical protein
MTAKSAGDLLRPHEAAALFRVATKTVAHWADEGTLTAVRAYPNAERRYRRAEVEALRDSLTDEPAPIAVEAPTVSSEALIERACRGEAVTLAAAARKTAVERMLPVRVYGKAITSEEIGRRIGCSRQVVDRIRGKLKREAAARQAPAPPLTINRERWKLLEAVRDGQVCLTAGGQVVLRPWANRQPHRVENPLRQLQDAGLVRREPDSRNVYQLTDAGVIAHVNNEPAGPRRPSWETAA